MSADTTEAPATPPARDGWADALAEADEVRDATLQRRYELLAGACAAVFEILARHPRREEILRYQDPVPASNRAANGGLLRASSR